MTSPVSAEVLRALAGVTIGLVDTGGSIQARVAVTGERRGFSGLTVSTDEPVTALADIAVGLIYAVSVRAGVAGARRGRRGLTVGTGEAVDALACVAGALRHAQPSIEAG